MSPTGLAISAILSLSMGLWLLQVGLDPKHWRLMWLDFFGVLDSDTTREERQAQAMHIRMMAMLMCLLLLAMSASCAFWCADQVQDGLRPKSSAERELEYLKRKADSARGR